MDTSQQIIKAISHKIKYKRSDNFLNHLKTYFQFDQVEYSGTYTEHSFKIWRYSQWVGIFYLVVYGEILFTNNESKVILRSRPNVVGLFFAIIIFCGFFFGFMNFRDTNFTLSKLILGLIFSILPILAISLGILNERRKCLNAIKEIIKRHT